MAISLRRVQGWSVVSFLALLMGLVLPERAYAQSSGDGFLFDSPMASLSVRAGYARALAGSDVFDLAIDELTVERGDFSGFQFEGDLGIALGQQVDLVLGAGYASSRVSSEYRDLEGDDGLPIFQETDFERLPLSASARIYMGPKGDYYGRHAWVPRGVVPYVGAGGGAMWYKFNQSGEFVDMETFNIFFDEYESSGWAPMAQAFAGVEFAISPRFVLTGEGKYMWAEKDLNRRSFEGFEPIDLSGFGFTAGFQLRI